MKDFLKSSLSIFAIFALVSFSSCSKDDGGIGIGACDITDELDRYENALNAYIENPGESTCNSLRDAALDLMDSLEGCTLYDYYAEATEEWQNMDCSEEGKN